MTEDKPLETITRSQFNALIDSIIKAIALPETDATHALETLKAKFGFSHDFSSNLAHTGEDSTKWEHPLLTQHNRRQGSRGILNQGFFTLYAQVHAFEEHRYTYRGFDNEQCEHVSPAHSTGYLEFCVGRIGNTYSIGREYNVIEDSPVLDDSQPNLFEEV